MVLDIKSAPVPLREVTLTVDLETADEIAKCLEDLLHAKQNGYITFDVKGDATEVAKLAHMFRLIANNQEVRGF